MVACSQKGSALSMTLFVLILFGILLVGITTLTNSSSRLATTNQTNLSAQNVAEAGAKIAIQQAWRLIKATPNGTNSTVTQASTVLSPNNSFSYKATYIYASSPYILIVAKGKYSDPSGRSTVKTVAVRIDATGAINLNQLFSPLPVYSKGSLSAPNTQSWGTTTTNGNVTAIQANFGDSLSRQAIFQPNVNTLCSDTSQPISMTFHGACNPNTSGYAGWGIYYGLNSGTTTASDTKYVANNPQGYIFQYDPGNVTYPKGSFFVKKAYQYRTTNGSANPSGTITTPSTVDSCEWSDSQNNYRITKNQPNAFFGAYDSHVYNPPTTFPTDPTAQAQAVTAYETALHNGDGTGNDIGLVSMSFLKGYMQYKRPGTHFYVNGNDPKDSNDTNTGAIDAYHNIQVVLKPNPDGNPNSPPVNNVYCDGILILSFIDRATTNYPQSAAKFPAMSYSAFRTKNTQFGLRVWGSSASFSAVPPNTAIRWIPLNADPNISANTPSDP